MANATIARKKLTRNVGATTSLTSISGAGNKLDLGGADYKSLILFHNAGNADATATIQVGNGIQGQGSTLAVTVEDGDYAAVVVDSGEFKNVSGTDKGYALVTASAALSAAVIELP